MRERVLWPSREVLGFHANPAAVCALTHTLFMLKTLFYGGEKEEQKSNFSHFTQKLHIRGAFYGAQPKAHLCNDHAV